MQGEMKVSIPSKKSIKEFTKPLPSSLLIYHDIQINRIRYFSDTIIPLKYNVVFKTICCLYCCFMIPY